MESSKIVGVVMDPQKSILNKHYSYEETAKFMTEHLLSNRSVAQPKWRTYILQEGLRQEDYDIVFDGKKFYPESKNGDVVYVAGDIWLEKDYEVWINVIGRVQVYLDGKCLFADWEEAERSVTENKYVSIPVNLNSGMLHHLVLKVVCAEALFGFMLNISPPKCIGLWANFYQVSARVVFPKDLTDGPGNLNKEEGMAVSPLYGDTNVPAEAYERHYRFEEHPVYAFPEIKKEEEYIDFNKFYKEGNTAFAYSQAEKDGFVVIQAFSKTKLLRNKAVANVLEKGEQVRLFLHSGDELLIKSQKGKEGWGFALQEANGLGFNFLDTNRAQNFRVAICGPFYQKSFDVKLPPERSDNLLQPFPNGNGIKVFWRFQNAYLRAYLDSSFFGQWYYANMLAFNGIRCCGETFDVSDYVEYFLDNERLMADWSEYAAYDHETFGFAHFMNDVTSGEYLDHIGTMGENFAEAYRITGERRYLNMIRLLQGRIKREVPRFEDGTFRRNGRKTMWADDFYMSGPFLTQLYSQFGDEESLKDILCQLQGFVKRLWMPEEKIFSHIYFWGEGVKNRIPWGRGNGWIAFSMSEMLMRIPRSNPAHEQIREVFCEFCEGLVALQDECGLWHQVLNKPESYLETSGSAMFTLAFYRGLRYGWLPERFRKYADKGLQAILERCVDEEGIVYGVCMGSSCSMDPQYYMNLTTIKDDNHGTGVVLMLLCERYMFEIKNIV